MAPTPNLVAADQNDLRPEARFRARVEQRLQVGPGARDKHADAQRHPTTTATRLRRSLSHSAS